MNKPILAVQLYSVRDELKKDYLGTLKTVKAMGYEGAEMFGDLTMPAEEVRDAFAAAGLKLVGWHTPLGYLLPGYIEATIAYHKVTGCPTVVVPALPSEYRATIDGWARAAEVLNTAAERLAKAGMKTGYHNHAVEFAAMDGKLPWDVLIGGTSKEVIMQLDTGNGMHGGADPIDVLNRYPGRSYNIHLKPYSKEKGYGTMIGRDDHDWKALIDLCLSKGGTQCFIVEYEDSATYPQLEGVKACREALKAYGL